MRLLLIITNMFFIVQVRLYVCSLQQLVDPHNYVSDNVIGTAVNSKGNQMTEPKRNCAFDVVCLICKIITIHKMTK